MKQREDDSNKKPEEWYLGQLRGRKHLIVGNHDARLLRNSAAMQYFESVEKMMHVADDIHHICLCHFPICDWNGRHKGHLHIYGHIHNRTDETYRFMKTRGRAYNAGCMINHYMPVSLKELIRNNEAFQAEQDTFYSSANIRYLKKLMEEYEAYKAGK